MSTTQRVCALLTLCIILGVTACSAGSTPTETATGGNITPTPIPTPSAATTGTATGGCPAEAGLPANTNIHGSAVASGSQLSIEASDFFFSPTCMTSVPGGTVTLTVHNAGVVLHNVSIPSLHIDMDMAPHQTISVQVKMGKTPLVYFCKYHVGAGMLGALLPSGSES
jgi:plastocyanin